MDPDTEINKENDISGLISKKDRSYTFSDVFDETYSNEYVYKSIYPIPPKVLSGLNCTIFAYGMTGAGKSHTMFGQPDVDPGINFRLLEDLFQNLSFFPNYSLRISYLEIYNEQIRDLLIPNGPNLLIFEDPIKGFMVSELTEYEVLNTEDLRKYVNLGNSRRTMASTAANQFSSRSHAILQILLEIHNKDLTSKTQSKLNLIDLAGSERASATDNRGLRMKEGANINRSLLTLGLCINILSDTNKKGVFVPYRDSKLTKLLKDSLGGNTLTFMIACISPYAGSYEETINTLKYASKAKNITKKVNKNVIETEMNVQQYKKIVDDLKKEIKSLRFELEEKTQVIHKGDSMVLSNSREKEKLFEEIGEKIFQNLQENWEISQSLNELNELHLQNEDRFRGLLEKKEIEGENNVNSSNLDQEIKGLKLIMENNEKVKRDLEFSLMTNQAEKRSLQEYLRNFSNPKVESHASLELNNNNDEIKGSSSLRMREMEREMEHMKRKLAEKDLLIEKNNELLKILKKNHDHSTNFSPQFYPLPHHIAGNKGSGSIGSMCFYTSTTHSPTKKSISGFNDRKPPPLINPIKLGETKSMNDPGLLSTQKLSERSHKQNPLIPQRLNTTFNDTSIMRGGVADETQKIRTISGEETYNINKDNIKENVKDHENNNINANITINDKNDGKMINIDSPLRPANKINNDKDGKMMNLINIDSPLRPKNQKINVSMDNLLSKKSKDSPIRVIKKISESTAFNPNPTTTTTTNNNNINNNNNNNSNNGLIINVIHIKGGENNNEKISIRKKSGKDISIKTIEYKNNEPKPTPNSVKGTSGANKYYRNMNVNVSYDSSQKTTNIPVIPVMKANLINKPAFNKPVNQPNLKASTISNISNNQGPILNKTFLSASSTLKKDMKININIKNLDRARENYRTFKEKLNKITQCLSQEKFNEGLKKNIQMILADYSQNQYNLSSNDQVLMKKLQDIINFPNKPIMIDHLKVNEEKTRSNSFNVLDTRAMKEDLKKHDTRNEDEILFLLNNKKFGRLSSDRINSDHQRNSLIYQENGE